MSKFPPLSDARLLASTTYFDKCKRDLSFRSFNTTATASIGVTAGGVSSRFASDFASLICFDQASRLARASTVPSGMFMFRAISRSPMPLAYAVLICSQTFAETLLRTARTGGWLFSRSLMFK
jgi:hypothetical protein